MPGSIKQLDQIDQFLKDFDLHRSSKVELNPVSIDIYRKFHALLCWQVVLNSDPEFEGNIRFEESLSDFSAAYLLFLTSAYKPSIASLRSGVENIVRSILDIDGINTDKIGAVWELFSLARSHFDASGNTSIKKRIEDLHSIYGELCKFVHSAGVKYMSLRVPFERVFKFESKSYTETQRLVGDVFRLSLESLYLLAHGKLVGANHRLADEIRDALSPTTKALVS